MLEFLQNIENDWTPPKVSEEEQKVDNDKLSEETNAYFIIFKTEPYIDAYYIHYNREGECIDYRKRFSFHEGYRWSIEDERLFDALCVNNDKICFDYGVIDSVYQYYSESYPDWNLKRYDTNSMRLFDHIYHCMRRGTAKEILYKAGLDELAANIDMMDEIDLLSSKPSDIYDGISMRGLRALNCKEGAKLLSTEYKRKFLKELQMKFPGIFKEKLNDAQSKYLNFLIEGELTVGEAGRLFGARRGKLMCIWAAAQYDMFIQKEKQNEAAIREASKLALMDPIYRDYIGKITFNEEDSVQNKIRILRFYLLQQREKYDIQFKRSNRMRNPNWQERDKGYVVRYPQTINDFCREAIYMSNCLMTYIDAYINNDTTILFMRKTDDYNTPFITIEIFRNKLMQAYHRYNMDCTAQEAAWILNYCSRHGIDRGEFRFDGSMDEL